MDYFFYIIIYLLSIYILYIIVFYKLLFPIKQKVLVVFLNNLELRGWWGFITHQLEVSFILWIPYKIKNIKFLDINKSVVNSFEPFKSNLSKNISFRDCNYSIFNEENFKRLSYFSKNSLGYEYNNFILLNFTFIESIFTFISIKFSWFIFSKKTLFRSLSHIVSDNPDWAHWRKNIILKFWAKFISFILFIPFYPHFILINIIKSIKNKDFFILNKSFKDKPKWNYIAIEENNLIWRKGNRYISNYTEYNFFVEEYKGNYIYWKWTIKILKTLLSDESFPISWDYKACIKWIFSDDFTFEKKYKLINIKNTKSFFYEIPFEFKLPNKWAINILKWPWTLNNNISINFQTKIFYLLSKTNLNQKIDHLNKENRELKRDFKLKYEVSFDKSVIKFQWMKIIKDWVISINFNKELINYSKNNFIIEYKWKKIDIIKITKKRWVDTNILIYYKKWEIEFYDFKKVDILASLTFYNILDKSWITHYSKWRKLNLIW